MEETFQQCLRTVCVFCFQLQKVVLAGDLPCSKEDAATLASIQLHIEEAWPEENLPNHGKADLGIFDRKLLDHHKYLTKTADPQENLRRRKVTYVLAGFNDKYVNLQSIGKEIKDVFGHSSVRVEVGLASCKRPLATHGIGCQAAGLN